MRETAKESGRATRSNRRKGACTDLSTIDGAVLRLQNLNLRNYGAFPLLYKATRWQYCFDN